MATPYHRLARETPAYAWWKLPVAGLVIGAAFVGFTMLLVGGAALWFVASGSGTSLDDWLDAAGELDLAQLDFFVIDMLSLAALIPAVLLGVLAVGPRPVGYLSSVAGRLRRGWLARTGVIAFAVSSATIGGWLLVGGLTGSSDVGEPSVDGHALTAIAVVLLVVPFQATAEEYLFRGYLMQLVGSWSRFAIVPVLVVTPLFVAGHVYEVWGLLDVTLFGLTAAVLTIRTGGLEAAIAAHVANNVVLFVLDALGLLSATDDSGAGPIDLVPTVLSSVLVLLLVERAARRHGVQRTREPIPEPPVPPAPLAPMWPPPPYAMIWYPPSPTYGPQHVPPAAPPRALHPDTPDYPGELPPGWGS
jgi:membrane protease YdiL (CAAX protease family)